MTGTGSGLRASGVWLRAVGVTRRPAVGVLAAMGVLGLLSAARTGAREPPSVAAVDERAVLDATDAREPCPSVAR